MPTFFPELDHRARLQPTSQPTVYGQIDLDRTPLRFSDDPDVRSALPTWVAERDPLLADRRLVDLVRTTTMLGDVVVDPYAALATERGLGPVAEMLRTACRSGIDAVPDAPEELRALVASMESTPDWVDMELVEEGARHARISAAFLSPFITRGAFLATFLNTYSALPMALTGALSGRRAAHRINDTTSYFALTTLPGALHRHGPGFEASAMVRLMHSIVRVRALTDPGRWNVGIYGVPIPQIDQMPAGFISNYVAAMLARRRGRHEFNDRERAMLEFSRYRGYLMGLPEELLPTTLDGIVDLFHARAALLRDDFDDTCRQLVTSTMDAYLRPDHAWSDRRSESVERSWSKLFVLGFCGGNRAQAAVMGVPITVGDIARVGLTAPFILGRFAAIASASQKPSLQARLDQYTTRILRRRLATYGRPELRSAAARG